TTNPFYCSAEWHLRKTPRAAALHSWALRVSETDEQGNKYFWVSYRQIHAYFGWSTEAIAKAFKKLATTGLFKLVRQGNEIESSKYVVLTHEQLPEEKKAECTQNKSALEIEALRKPKHPAPEIEAPRFGNRSASASETEAKSPKESPTESPSERES